MCNCILQRVLPDFAPNGDVELLQRFLVLGIGKVEIVDIRKLDWNISEEVTFGNVLYLRRMECRTRATLAGVCSPGPDLSKSERSFTDPVNGTRMILVIGCERYWQ
jgi:hypothetical protein